MPSTSGRSARGAGGGSVVTVRVPKMAELVVAQLRRQIIRGELQEGDALPSESELMTRYGVSRPTLREAFRVLESESLISVRRGAHGGARVHTPSRRVAAKYASFMLEYRGVTLRDVYEARVALEVPGVGELARTRTRADLAALLDSLNRHAAAEEEDSRLAIMLHGEFHTLVIQRAGNGTLLLLSEMLQDIIDLGNVSLHADAEITGEQARAAAVRTHRRLYDHIVARDISGAESLWRRHLDESMGYLLGENAAMTVSDLFD
ncbi:GntR family transcriptional regulator [Williamsia limnetica]|uniref:GntR family transcriptional regulator n=1 Tax=Williamsia limnetica TaxID=882452 RepID=A0A318RI09_WILLI|nr:GntR family transcriptional regulator [Williamsia limnetica]PYE16938.1 GntR family transcriptional regulator [Williamsia limnetica]